MAEKRHELVSHDWDRAVCLSFLFVLLSAETDPVPKERRGKRNLSRPCSSSSSKIVLTLLTEVIVVYVELSAVFPRGTGFQLLLWRLVDDKS